ncbi:MAG TPA: SPFH domain-containing protein [Verrucomicrobiae bacterium]|nr:SPFH domain-containing protein [Verrucomicrobiae bacterium]
MPNQRFLQEEENQPVTASRGEERSSGAGMAIILVSLGVLLTVGPFFVQQIPSFSKMIISAFGIAVLIAGGILLTITSMYVKATMNQAFVRTGGGGPKVVIDGGAIVVPAIHRIAWVSLETIRLQIEKTGDKSFITGDSLHVDVVAQFFIRVNRTPEAIKDAATSLGGRSGQDESIMRLVGDKLVSGLRTVAGRSNLDHLHKQVDEYSAEVKKIVEEDLAHNGLFLESVTVTYLNQTPLENLNPESNVFDALGAQKIAEVTNKSRVAISQARATADQQVKAQEVERDQKVFELDVTQKNARSESERKAAEYAAEQNRLSKVAQVTADQAVAVAEVDQKKAVEVAAAQQQQAVQAAQIEKDKVIEIAQRKKQADIANAETQRTAAETARIQAETEREKANQAMLTVQKESEAERQKRIAVIQKQAAAEQTKIERNMQADVDAYATIKDAEAEKKAAEDQAAAKLKRADADQQAKALQAEGDQAIAMIPVNVAAEQVKVDQSKVEVLKLELETKSANQRLSFELEVQKARIAAERDVRIAMATAMGQALSASDFKIYGDPLTAAKMLAMFTSGQEYAQVIDGFVQNAPPAVTDLAMASIGTFSEAAAALVKKLFGQDLSPSVIAQAVQTHMKESTVENGAAVRASAAPKGH